MVNLTKDLDPIETQEWLEAFEGVVQREGFPRAKFLLEQMVASARRENLDDFSMGVATPYINTIPSSAEPVFPGNEGMETRITACIRWNALMMVLRAAKKDAALGGHLASYASAATLYEVGFQHFFKGSAKSGGGDLVFFQGHSSPGIYARAFLEGRLNLEQLDHFRQEIGGRGLSSYPHPYLMPEFWQFPTVSMGLGMLQAIYQARFLKYLTNRNLIDSTARKVWLFAGDGEMDEPESLGALIIASRELLDNLIVVINCNLQRLDGPVRGNGKIIQELEGVFRGAGWRVIKLIWGSQWEALLAKDSTGLLKQRMLEVVDGDYQTYAARDGAYLRAHFFGKYPELQALVADWSDEALMQLTRGGHDIRKVYAAYDQAVNHPTGQPTVILAKTVKGYGLGAAGEAQNIAHQQKKMTEMQLRVFRDRFQLPIDDEAICQLSYYHPGETSPEVEYLKARRQALGGYLPSRQTQATHPALAVPTLEQLRAQLQDTGNRPLSTTMFCVKIKQALLKNKQLGPHTVFIVPDEARTFGMESLFRQIGIYSPVGQQYKPVDAEQVMFYRESKAGQFLQEGISEAGAFASWLAAATAYSTHQITMVPFYIYYAMFGMQRIGDLAWAAADSQARGFLLGALAGRTTLAGEGLQHQDGHNLLFFSAIPNCVTYDPAFSYELLVIIQDGLRRMIENQENIFYYLTLMNESYVHPPMPEGVTDGIIKGMYQLSKDEGLDKTKKTNPLTVQLLGSGAILLEVIKASSDLVSIFGINSVVWSVTSFSELRREALAVERMNLLHPDQAPKVSYVSSCLNNASGPVIAVSDYMRLNAEQIRAFLTKPYVTLGTDGFGRSDTRTALRDFFEVDARYIVIAALKALADEGKLSPHVVLEAMQKYKINAEKVDPIYA
jgi:pyruvate dehydrogenase E1 component